MSLALDANKKLVHIAEVENGKKCNCVCLDCGSLLIACNKGEKQQDHFKHAVERDCQGESVIHRAAKQMIREKKEIVLSEYSVKASKRDSRGKEHVEKKAFVKDGEIIQFDLVQEEIDLDGMRADILASKRDKPLIIEIFYRHKVDHQKRMKIIEANISAIEINLSDLKHEGIKNLGVFWSYIIDHKRVKWLNNAKDPIYNEEVEKLLAIKIQEEEEKYKQQEKAQVKKATVPSLNHLEKPHPQQYVKFSNSPYLSRRGPRIEWVKPNGTKRLGNRSFNRKKK